jgi:hypothetical protein
MSTTDEKGVDIPVTDRQASIDERERDADARDRAANLRDDTAPKREECLDHREVLPSTPCCHEQTSVIGWQKCVTGERSSATGRCESVLRDLGAGTGGSR